MLPLLAIISFCYLIVKTGDMADRARQTSRDNEDAEDGLNQVKQMLMEFQTKDGGDTW